MSFGKGLTLSLTTKFWTRPNWKHLQMTNVIKMIVSVFDRVENIVGKGEIACTSNFSFSYNVFKRLLTQTRQMLTLCGNGLRTTKSVKGVQRVTIIT